MFVAEIKKERSEGHDHLPIGRVMGSHDPELRVEVKSEVCVDIRRLAYRGTLDATR